jgi:hypothetical protein
MFNIDPGGILRQIDWIIFGIVVAIWIGSSVKFHYIQWKDKKLVQKPMLKRIK